MKEITTFIFPIVGRRFIFDALTTLEEHTPYPHFTIVVDQTRPDLEFETRLRGMVDLWIKPKHNLGFAEASNLGIRLAPTPFITVMNDDVVFLPNPYPNGWFQGILQTFQKYTTAAAVGPMSPREPGWGYGKPGYIEHLSFEESQDVENIGRLIKEKKGQMIDGITCWGPTFRADYLARIGLFDERYFPGAGEDYDWCGRCYLRGYRALATSLAWVYHHWGQSKDEPDGLDQAQPPVREQWNKERVLWPQGFDLWGKDPETQEPLPRVPEVARLGF